MKTCTVLLLIFSLCSNSAFSMDNFHGEVLLDDSDIKQIIEALNQQQWPDTDEYAQWKFNMNRHAYAIASRVNRDKIINKEHLVSLKKELKCENFDINCLKKIRCNIKLLDRILTHGMHIKEQFEQHNYESLKDVSEDERIPEIVRSIYRGGRL